MNSRWALPEIDTQNTMWGDNTGVVLDDSVSGALLGLFSAQKSETKAVKVKKAPAPVINPPSLQRALSCRRQTRPLPPAAAAALAFFIIRPQQRLLFALLLPPPILACVPPPA